MPSCPPVFVRSISFMSNGMSTSVGPDPVQTTCLYLPSFMTSSLFVKGKKR
jgi:hypothetical protein